MDTKLTLKLNSAVIERAKAYASKYDTSLSRLIEAYLDNLTKKEKRETEPLTPLVQSLYGIASLPAGFDEKDAYFDFLLNKHSPEDAAESVR